MKILIFVLLALFVLTRAQIGDYSHFVGGSFNRAGYHGFAGLAAWDSGNNRYKDIPPAVFSGGARGAYAAAAVAGGVMVVGDFTSVNGFPAGGIAFFNGSAWCSFNHLSLFYYNTPNPLDTTNPGNLLSTYPLPNRNLVAGSATAIQVVNNQVYIFGGLNGGAPRFNQIGTNPTTNAVGYAGLVRLNVQTSPSVNFTVDTSFNQFITQPGKFTGNPAPSVNGFPADSQPTVSTGAAGPKMRVITTNPLYVCVGSGAPQCWSPNFGRWFNPLGANIFNISGTLTTFVINNPPPGAVSDWDADISAGRIFVAGNFLYNVSNTIYQNVAYLDLPTSFGTTVTVTWNGAVTWGSNNFVFSGFTGLTVNSIAVNNRNEFYISAPYIDKSIPNNANNRLGTQVQNRIFKVDGNGNLTPLGVRFNQQINQLSYYNGQIYAFGPSKNYYNQDYSAVDFWRTKYIRTISGAVTFVNNDWQDAYGGFISGGSDAITQVAVVGGIHYLFNNGANVAYDIWSQGLTVFNNNANIKKWFNAANFRFSLRSNNDVGGDGQIWTVHFLNTQRAGVTDSVVVAGNFDWYGTQFLGSVAFLRTNTITSGITYETLGGGLWNALLSPAVLIDQDQPILTAGTVYKIEEANSKLYAAGTFSKNINLDCLNNVGAVNYLDSNGLWYSLGSGCDNTAWDVLASGSKVYFGGAFQSCGGVPGTRGIAYWDESQNPPTWNALGTGIPSISAGTRVYAMEWYSGSLYVGGTFGASPGNIREPRTGLFRWDGNQWWPVYARCEKDCSITEFEAPFQTSTDPVMRAVSTVRSLRSFSGTLYVQGVINGGSDNLLGYDGNAWRQFGSATGSAGCQKQGCISRNTTGSLVIGVNFNEAGGYNPNYQAWDKSKNNWVETFSGFEGGVNFIASASIYSISLLLSFVLIIFYIIF